MLVKVETEFENRPNKEFRWNVGALFSSSLYCKIFSRLLQSFVGKIKKIAALRPRFRIPRSHAGSNLLTNR